MKNKTHIATIIFLSLILFITLGCQITSNAVPSVTPTASPVPTDSPTQTPTLTPTPALDISSAVLTLDDLPPGFEVLYPEDLGISMDDFSDDDFHPEEIFVFINPQNFQAIIGFNFLLNDRIDRIAFDAGLSKPEITLPALVDGMGSGDIQNEKVLEELDDVGEKQMGMTMVIDMEGVPVQVDVMMFRQDVVGAMLMSMFFEGTSPNITLHELGLKLNQHFEESLQP